MPVVSLKKERSFRFEIRKAIGKKSILMDHFNLIHPPESYSIDEMNRHGIMKVFTDQSKLFNKEDNIFIDDFGADNKIIKLSGTTGGVDVKFGWKDRPLAGSLDGKDAMAKFRKEIINWSTRGKYSRMDRSRIVFVLVNLFDEEEWEVFITKFQMNKKANKPLFYNYNIEMITIKRRDSVIGGLRKAANAVSKAKKFVDRARAAVARATEFLTDNKVSQIIGDAIDTATNTINGMNALIDDVDNLGEQLIKTYVTDNINRITNLISSTDALFQRFIEFDKQFTQTAQEWRRMGDSCVGLITATKGIVQTLGIDELIQQRLSQPPTFSGGLAFDGQGFTGGIIGAENLYPSSEDIVESYLNGDLTDAPLDEETSLRSNTTTRPSVPSTTDYQAPDYDRRRTTPEELILSGNNYSG